MIVQPIVANIMNAVLCGLMSFGLIMTPQKFMQGGKYQEPWFNNLPDERDNKVYYLGQFMGLLMLGGVVVPTLLQPDSQFLCYQMAVVQGINIIHSIVFLCSSAYRAAKPTQMTSNGQWIFMTILSVGFWIVTVLACTHETSDVVDNSSTRVSKLVANSVMLGFSSIFGVLFTTVPRYLFSTFWEDETLEDPKKMCGFKLLEMTDLEYWWTRCIGLAILGLNLGVLIDLNIHQPLYTAGSLVTVSTLTLLNLHQVMMRPYKSISSFQVKVSWIPNILMGGAVAALLASALVVV